MMRDLIPYPFPALIRRMFRELAQDEAVFDLPASKFFLGDPERDLSVRFHGHRASSPIGPAAGPQTQLAQNLVLSWLGGCRIHELKTVQVLDELVIPRPCIDMRTVGLNAEWSQELKLPESLDEYVKGAMLIEMLRSSDAVELEPGFDDVIYDMSVGYDLTGIRSESVEAFLGGMRDATAIVDRLRREIPAGFAPLRDLDYRTALADTLTLSTFHGCPPQEIESIIDHLLHQGIHCVIKFNPTLLGPEETRRLLHEVMGYTDLEVPDTAFANDTRWDQAVAMVERLRATADDLGLGLGVKFSNTLIVRNTGGFLAPDESEVYLSGAPLHVLAMNLVGRWRERFGDSLPISFAAGIDRANVADAVSMGLTPITVCSDLLKPQGYARAEGYHRELVRRMDAVGADSIDRFVLKAHGMAAAALEKAGLGPDDSRHADVLRALDEGGDPRVAAGEALFGRWVSEARLLNTRHVVEAVTANPRYTSERNSRPPKKIGSRLELFDCISCDKCIPVCPNDANFLFVPVQEEIPVVKLYKQGTHWEWRQEDVIALSEKHQIANFADFCNECGNCDVFCPEDGGPYVLKPRFFGSEEAWRADSGDGFHVERVPGEDRVLGRFNGTEYHLRVAKGWHTFTRGEDLLITFKDYDPQGTVEGAAPEEVVDLTWCHIMDCVRQGVLRDDRVNYVNTLAVTATEDE